MEINRSHKFFSNPDSLLKYSFFFFYNTGWRIRASTPRRATTIASAIDCPAGLRCQQPINKPLSRLMYRDHYRDPLIFLLASPFHRPEAIVCYYRCPQCSLPCSVLHVCCNSFSSVHRRKHWHPHSIKKAHEQGKLKKFNVTSNLSFRLYIVETGGDSEATWWWRCCWRARWFGGGESLAFKCLFVYERIVQNMSLLTLLCLAKEEKNT